MGSRSLIMQNQPSLFTQIRHPFAWFSPDERQDILANAEHPLWSRFISEASEHFAASGKLPLPTFPLFCHDGDLDEVMALAIVAFVRGDKTHWQWIGEWLAEMASYARTALPLWKENRNQVLRGNWPHASNPRQFIEGFTRDGLYWVEAGLMSSVLHLLDLLESEAPQALSEPDKITLLDALADYATRYAFHEESVKYSNRGIWANAGVLISALCTRDSMRAGLLLQQCHRRSAELRSTFFDDGMHAEGSPDYHLMAADGLLCYSSLARNALGENGVFEAHSGTDSPFERYPSFVEIVKAGMKTVLPGPTPWNQPRGCSVSIPLSVNPSLLYAYKISQDPELGWFIQQCESRQDRRRPSPLRVTSSALLGLGNYQPLLNFWIYRNPRTVRAPQSLLDVLPDHGSLVSRSGWDAEASSVTVRFGYEGTGKGHRDHGQILIKSGPDILLADPFPRHGPAGLDSSLFHNTVTLNRREPIGTIGRLLARQSLSGVDAFLITNQGGNLPHRYHLHDPREESQYWFANQPGSPDFRFDRAVTHLHRRRVIGIDLVTSLNGQEADMDWFFHTYLRPDGYDPTLSSREDLYQLQQRNVLSPEKSLPITLHGDPVSVPAGKSWTCLWRGKNRQALFSVAPLDHDLLIDFGSHYSEAHRSGDGISYEAEQDYFLRLRTSASRARLVWSLDWSENPSPVEWRAADETVTAVMDGLEFGCDFAASTIALLPP